MGNFWQGAVTGLVVSGLNHYMHKMQGDDEVTKDAKEIARKYGHDWRKVKEFLMKHPFKPTHKGIELEGTGEEVYSSKKIDGNQTVSDYIQDQGESALIDHLKEYFLPKNILKVLDAPGNLLDTTEFKMKDTEAARNDRYQQAKEMLIKRVFLKPSNYQTPTMRNNQQQWNYGPSRFELMTKGY